jgi:hypothetical protein
VVRSLLLAAITLSAGCAVRSTPYRFAGPLVSGVSLDDRAEHGDPHRRYDDGLSRRSPIAVTEVPGTPRSVVPPSGPDLDVSGASTIHGTPLNPDVGAPSGTVVISRLPEPHRQGKAKDGEARIDLSGLDDVDDMRTLVGSRDGREHVAFALAVSAALHPDVGAPAAADGPALVELARKRGALGDPDVAGVVAGDLLVFDRVSDGEAASLVAVVLGRDERGVVEMMYVARGVVRRGFVDPARPQIRRDKQGRVVNTYLRHGKEQPPEGTRYLAGELLAHVVSAGRLVAPVGFEPTLERV